MITLDLKKFFTEDHPKHILLTFNKNTTMEVIKYSDGFLVTIKADDLKPFLQSLQRFDDHEFIKPFKVKEVKLNEATLEECYINQIYLLLKLLSNKIELYEPSHIKLKELG